MIDDYLNDYEDSYSEDYEDDSTISKEEFEDEELDEEDSEFDGVTDKKIDALLEEELFSGGKLTRRITDEEYPQLLLRYRQLQVKRFAEGLDFLEQEEQSNIFSMISQSLQSMCKSAIKKALNRIKVYNDMRYYAESIAIGKTNGLMKAILRYNLNQTNSKFTTFAFACVENDVSGEVKKHFKSLNNDVSFEMEVGDDKDSDSNGELGSFVSDTAGEETLDEQMTINAVETDIVPGLFKDMTKEQRAVLIFLDGMFGVQAVTQEELAKYLGLAQPTISAAYNQGIAHAIEYFKDRPASEGRLYVQYKIILDGKTARNTDNVYLAPYQAYAINERQMIQELFDKGMTPEEISDETGMTLKKITSIEHRLQQGEWRKEA